VVSRVVCSRAYLSGAREEPRKSEEVRRSLFFFFFFREKKTFCFCVVVVAKNWIANGNILHKSLTLSLFTHHGRAKNQIVQKNESDERDLLTVSGGE